MTVKNDKFTISSKGFDDLIDITSKVQSVVDSFKVKQGIVNVSVLASTASIITMEQEPGLAFDLKKLFQEMIPINQIYQHDNLWHEGNAFAHLKATILGNNLALSVIDGKIMLNTYQQIVLVDFDNKPSARQIVVSVVE